MTMLSPHRKTSKEKQKFFIVFLVMTSLIIISSEQVSAQLNPLFVEKFFEGFSQLDGTPWGTTIWSTQQFQSPIDPCLGASNVTNGIGNVTNGECVMFYDSTLNIQSDVDEIQFNVSSDIIGGSFKRMNIILYNSSSPERVLTTVFAFDTFEYLVFNESAFVSGSLPVTAGCPVPAGDEYAQYNINVTPSPLGGWNYTVSCQNEVQFYINYAFRMNFFGVSQGGNQLSDKFIDNITFFGFPNPNKLQINISNNASITNAIQGDSVQFRGNYTSGILLDTCWFQNNDTGTVTNVSVIDCSSNGNFTFINNITVTAPITSFVCGSYGGNTSDGDVVVSENSCFTVIDVVPPSSSSIINNASTGIINSFVKWTAVIRNNFGLDSYFFGFNDSGTFVNGTPVKINQTQDSFFDTGTDGWSQTKQNVTGFFDCINAGCPNLSSNWSTTSPNSFFLGNGQNLTSGINKTFFQNSDIELTFDLNITQIDSNSTGNVGFQVNILGNSTVLYQNNTEGVAANVTVIIPDLGSGSSNIYLSYLQGIGDANIRVDTVKVANREQIVVESRPIISAENVNVCGIFYFNDTFGFMNQTKLSCFTQPNLLRFNATAFNSITNETLLNFSVRTTGITNPAFTTFNTTSTGLFTTFLTPGNYSFNFSSSGFSNFFQTLNITPTGTNTINASMFPDPNSISILILNASDETPLTQLVNINVLGPTIDTPFTTSTGSLFMGGLETGTLTVVVSSDGWAQRTYFVTLADNDHADLTARLVNLTEGNTQTVTLTIKDSADRFLPDATINVARRFNATFLTVDQSITDISGQAQFDLDKTQQYQFTITATGFVPRQFLLVPLNTAYSITLTPSAQINFTNIFDLVQFSTSPTTSIIKAQPQTFNFTTVSNVGAITFFGFNISTQNINGFTNTSGSPSGGTQILTLNLTGTTGQTVTGQYFIQTAGFPLFQFNRTFIVETADQPSNQSLLGAANQFGVELSNPMKAFIAVTVSAVLAVGVAAFLGGVEAAMVAFGIQIVFMLIGWISIIHMGLMALVLGGVWLFIGRRGT